MFILKSIKDNGLVSRSNKLADVKASLEPAVTLDFDNYFFFLRKFHYIAMDREAQIAFKLKQGRPCSGVELKLTNDEGERLPHDGKTFGRLKIKGAIIASAYFKQEGGNILDEEGFFDTGDVSTIDEHGYMQITDRAKDVIKSGGEWVSSVDL